VKIRTAVLLTVFSLTIMASTSSDSFGQRSRSASPKPAASKPTPPAKAQPNLLASLPQSDAVALVGVHRLLDEALPKIFAGEPAKLAEVKTEIDKFKTKTGIDPRSFDQVALGLRYSYPSPRITKIDTVALARGTFSAAAFVAAGRLAANGKYREEKYQGRTIYIFTLDQPVKVFGLYNMRVHELAVTALESNILALGNPEGVRSVIDASRGRGGLNAELIELATRDPTAIIGFGGNVTPKLIDNVNITNEEITKDLSAVRQVYGSVGLSEKDLVMFLAARTDNADSARNLSDTLGALKQFGAMFVGRLPAPKGSVARAALDNLKITTQGNELQIRTAVAQVDIAPLVRGL
jgi:hypothetical protein